MSRAITAESWLGQTDIPTQTGIPVLPGRYLELRNQLVIAVRRVCPDWLTEDAEDVVQDALIRLIQRNERAGGNLSVTPAYLKKVAYCAVVDEMRRRQRDRESLTLSDRVDTDQLADEAPDHHDDEFISGAISRCLARQTLERRRALTLYLLGHSVPEAARILGCKPKSAENLIYRGLAQLRECLTKRGMSP